MPNLRGTTLCGRGKLRVAAIATLFCLILTSGCKTSDDTAAAATQLTATASSLTSYYSALDTILSETDQLYQIQAAINPLAPVRRANQELRNRHGRRNPEARKIGCCADGVGRRSSRS